MNNFNEPSVLYHYTSLNAFFSIVDKKEFRLYDITKSNDPLEGVYSIQVLEDAYDSLYHDGQFDRDEYLLAHRAFLQFKYTYFDYERTRDLYAAASFCKPNHELSMLRVYADNGCGLALGFRVKELERLAKSNPNLTFKQVEYISSKQFKKRAEQFWIEKIKHFKSLIIDVNEDTLLPLVDTIAEWYCQGFFIKDEANKDEEEYRLLYRLDNLFRFSLLNNETVPKEIDFEAKNGDLKAYYKIMIGEKVDSLLCFKDIILGPSCDATICDIQAFLRKHGIKHCCAQKNSWIKMR